MQSLLRRLIAFARDLRAHLAERPIRIGIVSLALALGGVAGLPVSEAVYRYQWADARFCDDCHVHDYANEAWARSVHGGLTTCHDCHRVPIRHYPRNLYVTVVRPPAGPNDIHRPDVETVICESCHSESGADHELISPMPPDVRRRVLKIDESPLHKLHLSSKTRRPGAYRGEGEGDSAAADPETGDGDSASVGGPPGSHTEGDSAPAGGGHGGEHRGGEEAIGCMDCHGGESNRAHRFESTAANCVVCHQAHAPEVRRMGALNCRDCHFSGFLAP